jgi:hypothetical protein
MKKIGIISYNIYGNFTNYGSVLQSWALNKVLKNKGIDPVLVDYCPNVHLDKDILNPLEKMWDQDEESRLNCQKSLPAIEKNYKKIDEFFSSQFCKTQKKYTSINFNESLDEVDAYICGSDTIFCIDESNGFDDGFFANYDCMKNNAIAYAASFGDTNITDEQYVTLSSRIKNFKAIGLRESKMLNYVQTQTDKMVEKTIDPTLLLTAEDYNEITAKPVIMEKYLLLYTRRYNPEMQAYAEKIAEENGWKIVEISLRATNAEKGHIMKYAAGVEEFLSLIKNAEYVVTNSFHGLLFSVQFKKQFAVFSRQTGDSKIQEVLDLFGLSQNLLTTKDAPRLYINDYEQVHERIKAARKQSLSFLEQELEML